MVESVRVPLESIRRWLASPAILVNREIHFHTKSASIRGALKGERVVIILSHAYYFLRFSNMLLNKYVACRVIAKEAQSISVPNWAKSIRLQFVIFSWQWASHNSTRKKINIANEIKHLRFRDTLISTKRSRRCLASTARGLAETLWISSTNTSSVVLLPQIIWHFCIWD